MKLMKMGKKIFSNMSRFFIIVNADSFTGLCKPGSSGETLTNSAESGYIYAKLFKMADKNFLFSVNSLSTGTLDFLPRGSTPLGGM